MGSDISARLVFLGDTSSAVRSLRTLEGSTSSLGRAFRLLRTAAITGFVGGIAAALKMAGDFEQVLNVLQATTGATSAEMARMRRLAIALGKDMRLPATSAKDAAEAMLELSKGGLSVHDTMKATRGVLQLSTAAQISNAEAAKITARALNAFSLDGSKAAKVADVLANAAVKSTGEISDFALGLQQSSAVAKNYGLSIQETVGLLAQFADAGIVGSDAGTMLKRMLQTLEPVTAKGAALMAKLGLHTVNAADGSLKLSATQDLFTRQLGKLDPVERRQVINRLAGSDAARGWIIAMTNGSAATEAATRAMDKNGTSLRIANAQTKGFKGAIDGLKSTAETLLIEVGTKLLPLATEGIRNFAEELSGAGPDIAEFAEGGANAAGDLAHAFVDLLQDVRPVVVFLGSDTGQAMVRLGIGMYAAGRAALFVAGAFTALKLAAVGFNPLLLPLMIVGGILAERTLPELTFQTDRTTLAFRRAKASVTGLSQSLGNLKQAVLNVQQAKLRLQLATAGVETAESAAAKAAAQYGRGSKEHKRALLDIRGATLDLKQAKLDLKKADDDEAKARAARLADLKKPQQALKDLRKEYEGVFDVTKKFTPIDAVFLKNLFEPARKIDFGKLRDFVDKNFELAGSYGKQAGELGKVDPKAANVARRLSAMHLATANLAIQLNKIPTMKQILVEVKLNYRVGGVSTGKGTSKGSDGGHGFVSATEGGTMGELDRQIRKGAADRAPEMALFPRADVNPGLWDELGLAAIMGLTTVSTFRAGATTRSGRPSLHGVFPSKAIDVSGSTSSMRAFFGAVKGRPGIRELIFDPYLWTPSGLSNIAGTQLGMDHRDHVHAGIFDVGGFVPGAPGAPFPILAHGGEVVLNPAQQDFFGGPGVFRAMFGMPSSGSSFAAGGIVGKRPPKRPPKRYRGRPLRKRFSPRRTGELGIDSQIDAISELEEGIRRDESSYSLRVSQLETTDTDLILTRTEIDPDTGEEVEVEYIDTAAVAREASEIDELIRLKRAIQSKIEQLKKRIAALIRAIKAAVVKLRQAIASAQKAAQGEIQAIAFLRRGTAQMRKELHKLEGKKKPSKDDKARIRALKGQIHQNESAESYAVKRKDSYLGQVSDFTGRMNEHDQSIPDYERQAFDLGQDIAALDVDVVNLEQDRAKITGTSVRPSRRVTAAGAVATDDEGLREQLRLALEELGRTRLALGVQGVQLPIIGSFQRGTIHVGQTGLALLHAGEKVTQSGVAGVGGGDGGSIAEIVLQVVVEDGAVDASKIRAEVLKASDEIALHIGRKANLRARTGQT